jgi:hypothetical protein
MGGKKATNLGSGTSLGDGHRDTKDGVGSELTLVGSLEKQEGDVSARRSCVMIEGRSRRTPSSLQRSSSISFCWVTSRPDLMRAGPRTSLTFLTALETPEMESEGDAFKG